MCYVERYMKFSLKGEMYYGKNKLSSANKRFKKY